MKTAALALLCCCLCASCALGSVNTKPGDTVENTQRDVRACKYQADHHAGATASAFVPFAGFWLPTQISRGVFRECLQAKGYEVIPPQ
jgi:hypothetical protein